MGNAFVSFFTAPDEDSYFDPDDTGPIPITAQEANRFVSFFTAPDESSYFDPDETSSIVDWTTYPHLIRRIISFADVPTLLVLRKTSKPFQHMANAVLCSHVATRPGHNSFTLPYRFGRTAAIILPWPGEHARDYAAPTSAEHLQTRDLMKTHTRVLDISSRTTHPLYLPHLRVLRRIQFRSGPVWMYAHTTVELVDLRFPFPPQVDDTGYTIAGSGAGCGSFAKHVFTLRFDARDGHVWPGAFPVQSMAIHDLETVVVILYPTTHGAEASARAKSRATTARLTTAVFGRWLHAAVCRGTPVAVTVVGADIAAAWLGFEPETVEAGVRDLLKATNEAVKGDKNRVERGKYFVTGVAFKTHKQYRREVGAEQYSLETSE
ncbi:uncharacterized protein EHS24_009520 [Apiotrichum porosum]|uniref:Uncharacterized protein n=1 Tax=Apiotrichum porosum TaxID=105984 RepID=A0A427XMB8_9TREE|nr:uncharacterized protein EHS24_009520 [Apiotrichum porosum]RSH79857.1 hypothetical protein EHS24_009520 [Apiotrichum porosum]